LEGSHDGFSAKALTECGQKNGAFWDIGDKKGRGMTRGEF